MESKKGHLSYFLLTCKTEIILDGFVSIHTDIYGGIIVPLTYKKHATKLCYIDLLILWQHAQVRIFSSKQ